MDFIGQKGPTSKIHLLALDLLVLFLQIVHMGVMVVKRKAKAAAESTPTTANAANTDAPSTTAPQQTVDFEERGQLRSDHQEVDIELQDLNPDSTAVHRPSEPAGARDEREEADQGERERLLAATDAPRSDRHIFDAFNSGEIMVADLNLANVVREQLILSREAAEAARAAASGASTAQGIAGASFSGSGLNLRIRVGNRTFGL